MTAPDTPQVLFDGKHLRARVYQPGCKRLFVSFDSYKPKRHGFDDRGPVRYFLGHGLSQLQIQTSRNDWYLNDDLEPLLEAVSDFVKPFRRVSTMAFSMGAYGALRMSRTLRLNLAYLVSPQVTPFSDRSPFDPRYAALEKGMRRDLELEPGHLQPGLRGYVLFDPLMDNADTDHARAVESLAPGMKALAFPMAGHPADKTILESGGWPKFQASLLDKKAKPAQIKALHRNGRGLSVSYLGALSFRLKARSGRSGGVTTSQKDLPWAPVLDIGPGKPESLTDST